MAQALLHREQHIGVAARLDVDHTVGMKARLRQRWREQVAPTQAPEDGTGDSRQDAGEEDRRACIIGEIRAARHFMECPSRDATAGQMPVYWPNPEGQGAVTHSRALDLRNPHTQVIKDGIDTHNIK
ncbi:MAG: hypothetical protein JWR80_9147 [Bradyrhizobium sp.]|nr:hypothetical protein [Bradyrhizobium sp.]